MKIEFLVIVLLCSTQVFCFQSSFIQDCLDAHNEFRARHGVPALSWSADIAVTAQKWANHLAAIDQLQHDSTTSDGENLFYMYGGDPAQACGRAVRNWYQEGKTYNYRSPHPDESTNHFSQLVWRGSKEVGIGTAQSKSGNFFLVARYSPRGNIDGQFNDNVQDSEVQSADESSQDTKDNNQPHTSPVQDESPITQPSPDHNLVHFKEVNYDSSATGMENTAAPNLPPPQQADVESGTNQSPSLEGNREPEASFSTSQPETQNSESTQPSDDGDSEMKQTPSSSQEGLTEPGPMNHNADAGSTSQNERLNLDNSEANRNPSSSETQNSNTEPTQDVPLREGSELNSINLKPRINPGSEQSDAKANPSDADSRPLEAKPSPGTETGNSPKQDSSYERQEEKDARLETFAKLQMNDELPTKSNEPLTQINEPPTQSNEPPTKISEPPTKSKEPLTKSDEPPAKSNEPLAKSNEPLAKSNEPPTESNKPLTKINEQPTKINEPLTKSYKPPTKSNEPPSAAYVAPVNAKVPEKKPVLPVKLPPGIALITPKRGKDFRVEIRFPKLRYTQQMRVPGSLAFEEIKRNVTLAIINLFDDDDQFEEVQLISLRNGSVIAILGLLFRNDTPGHLNRLSMALLSGKLGDMAVMPKYVTAVALPAGYLRPNRPAQQRPSMGVCPQPCSKPNICYRAGCAVSCCAFHPHKYHPPAHVPAVLPTCPGTCDDDCFPECDDDCCGGMMDPEDEATPAATSPVSVSPVAVSPMYTAPAAPAPQVSAAPVAPVSSNPGIMCPGSCHFSCFPQCSPQCCASQYVQNPCHPSCPAYCAPTCDNACCAARKSAVNSLSRQYSRYRSAQRALARQLYLKKRLRLPAFRRPKPVKLARPVRPRQRSYYLRFRLKPESLGLEEYDRRSIHSRRAGKYGA